MSTKEQKILKEYQHFIKCYKEIRECAAKNSKYNQEAGFKYLDAIGKKLKIK